MCWCLNKVTFSFRDTHWNVCKWNDKDDWGLHQNLSGVGELGKIQLNRLGVSWSLLTLFHGYMELLTLNFLLWYMFEVFHNKMFETLCVDLDLVDPFLCPFFTWLGNGCGTGDPAASWLPGRLGAWRWEWPSRKMVKGLRLWCHWWAPDLLHKNKLYFFKPLLVAVVIVCCCCWGYPSWYDVYAVNLTFSKKVLKNFKPWNRLIQKYNINSSFSQHFFLVYLLRSCDL